jgi:arginase
MLITPHVFPSLRLLSYACGAGARNHDCSKGPLALYEFGLEKYLTEIGLDANWHEKPLSLNMAQHNDFSHMIDASLRLMPQIKKTLLEKNFPVMLGGDHSMAMSSWSSVANYHHAIESFGLIWVDAHMDAHTPKTSPSGAFHGMPLAALLGYGNPDWLSIGMTKRVLSPAHVTLIGVRDFETEENIFLRSQGVKIFTMDEINKIGLEAAFEEALLRATSHTRGFGITIDLDVFDPEEAPGVGSPAAKGLHSDEFLQTIRSMRLLKNYKKLKAIEIAEYNPKLDIENRTAALTASLIGAMLGMNHKMPMMQKLSRQNFLSEV